MSLAASLLRKVVTAEATGEWFDGQVRGNMIPECTTIVEIGATLVTDVRPLARMNENVPREIGG